MSPIAFNLSVAAVIIVRFLRYSADPIMPALATRAGGEAVELPD